MKHQSTVTIVAALLFLAFLSASVVTRRKVEAARGGNATLEEILYVPSGQALKRMSLGYSGLLADIYWTRAVQYFGARVQHRGARFDLLPSLLDITTDLDPRLMPAYETGSIFLSQKPPVGAGDPDRAVALLEKGIKANPESWQLYLALGFIHYMDRKDYKAAQEAFETGSDVPGAAGWMKVMAARMAEHRGDLSTARMLWKAIYDTQANEDVRKNAIEHLRSLEADAGINVLNQRVQAYRQNTGALPRDWQDLVRERLLPGIPLDPFGKPFRLMPDGTVQVQDPSQYLYLGEFGVESNIR